MSIAGNCPGCGHAFRFPESARGQSARCKTCGEQFCVPPRVVVLEQSPARPRLSAFGYVRWVGVPLIALAFFGWIAAHLAVRAFTKHQQADQPADQQLGSVARRIREAEHAPAAVQPAAAQLVKVELIQARIGLPRIKFVLEDVVADEDGPSGEYYRRTGTKRLLVRLAITNVTQNRVIHLKGWGQSWGFDERATLTDELGNRYLAFRNDLRVHFLDQLENVTLAPGQSAEDLIVFERPLDQAQSFVLILPHANVEEAKEDWKFQFTHQQIKR